MARVPSLDQTLARRRTTGRARHPRQPRAEATRQAIVDGALRAITRAGTMEVSMRDFAQHAGVSVGSIYEYFDDRAALLRAAFARTAERRLEVLEAAVDAGQSLEAAIGAVCALPPILPPTPRRQLHALMTASADRSYVEAIDARAAVVLERVGVHGATTRARLARRLIEASLLDGALEAERSSLVAGLLAVLESER